METRRPFTEEELILCIYAARYGADDIGGIEAVRSLHSRSYASIKLKVQNIVAMLDEEGIGRAKTAHALTGLPAGKKGRRTNWDLVSKYLQISKEEHLFECQTILLKEFGLPGELIENSYREGAIRKVVVNSHERNPQARKKCIDYYGSTCVVCDFDFAKAYGDIAKGFIHVHHLKALSEIGEQYELNPIEDLRPVCPNCHAVIHLGGGTRTIDDMRRLIKSANSDD